MYVVGFDVRTYVLGFTLACPQSTSFIQKTTDSNCILQDSSDGFFCLVEGLLDDVFCVSSLVRRVASHSQTGDYQTDVEDRVDLSDTREEILNRVSNVITQVRTYMYVCTYIIYSTR